MQSDLVQKIRRGLFEKWQALTYNSNMPLYFYCISKINTGWGVVIPEMLGVIKHSVLQNYRVCFIANPGTNTETLRLFDNISSFELWERCNFLHFAEIETYDRLLSVRIDNSDRLNYICANDSGFNYLFPNIPNFSWPFSDLLRCIVHNTEFIHPDFTLSQSNMTSFVDLTHNGINSNNQPIQLKHENILKARKLLQVDDSLRFVLSIREAPSHHGLDRNTEPEELDQLLQEVSKFTSKLDLIGTKPSKKLTSVFNKYVNSLNINVHTFEHYEVRNYTQTDSGDADRHLISTYLLTTPSVKLLANNGILCYPSASGQFFGVFNVPNIFFQDQYHMISCPRRFNQIPNLSPLKAFVFGLSTMHDGNWFLDRIPASPGVVFSAIKNLLNQINSRDLNSLHNESIYNPRCLNIIRKELTFSPKIVEHDDLKYFGRHLIQDMPGLPLRYS